VRSGQGEASKAAGATLSERVQEFRTAIASPLNPVHVRIEAAGKLALLDPDFEAEGAAELHAYLGDESVTTFTRIHAAEALVKVPGQAKAAHAVMTKLMRDPGVAEYHRASAAAALAGADAPGAGEALDVCYRFIVGDHGLAVAKWRAADALREHAPALARHLPPGLPDQRHRGGAGHGCPGIGLPRRGRQE
jgi:hypothetical protein